MVQVPEGSAGGDGGAAQRWACSIAHGWFAAEPGAEPAAEPPYELDAGWATGCDEVEATLEDCAWIFPPYVGETRKRGGAKYASATGAAIGLASAAAQGGAGPGAAAEGVPDF